MPTYIGRLLQLMGPQNAEITAEEQRRKDLAQNNQQSNTSESLAIQSANSLNDALAKRQELSQQADQFGVTSGQADRRLGQTDYSNQTQRLNDILDYNAQMMSGLGKTSAAADKESNNLTDYDKTSATSQAIARIMQDNDGKLPDNFDPSKDANYQIYQNQEERNILQGKKKALGMTAQY